ncbi:MerR family DNA-binding transcriptional regulator [Paraliobacillus sp. JSM ZJ581]|uniref:MerR family DNA-binding transcriptional regulator n=1 Tax=Paraliobacillus sp. JSM ZJ581 TaxID=3342118 RepID=UPI0035A847E3
MSDLIKIGDFAKLNNLSVQTLRYYESINLFDPYFVDPITNYRYYHILQSPIIDSIQFLKSCNFSLVDIKLMLAEKTPNVALQRIVEEKSEELLNEQKNIETKVKKVHSFLKNNAIYEDSLLHTSFEINYFPKRYLYTFSIPANIYDLTEAEYERYLRKFKQHLTKENFSEFQFSHVGSITRKEDVLKEVLVSNTMFVFCPASLRHHEQVIMLPEAYYAIDYCHDFKDEEESFYLFREKILSKNKRIDGDYMCEVIREIPHSTKLKRNMCIRMQLPVI